MKINFFTTPPLTPRLFTTLVAALLLLTSCMTGDDSKTTEYKLSFSANGGTGEMESITKEEKEKINLPAVKFSRTGFEFLNWNTVADGSGTAYADGAEFTFNTDTMLHAQWKEKKTAPSTSKTTYNVIFDANGGNGTIASISVEERSEITLPENTFTKSSYIFAGWATSADGDVSYSDKAKITITGNIMLYAKWTVAAENAVNAINSLPTGEHKIVVTGQMTKEKLNDVIAAIKGNSNGAKVYLDLGGTAIDFYDWQSCKFADCENLIGIVIPSIEPPDNESQYELLVADVFKDCKNLKTVIISNSSDYRIGYTAFKDCTSLEYVEIPTSIVCIYSDAFDGCTALETITYKGTVEQWKQVKTDYKNSKYKLMSLNVQCENGTASGFDLIEE